MGASSTEAELQTRIRQQEVVAGLGQQALVTDELDERMHDATVAVAETLETEYCHVLELLPDGGEFLLRQGVGWREGTVGNAAVPTEQDSQAGYTLLSKETIIVDDLREEDRFTGNELLVDHGVVSGITVLVGSNEKPWGVLGTFTTERREITEHDDNFVQNVANVLASAIENERTESELEGSTDASRTRSTPRRGRPGIPRVRGGRCRANAGDDRRTPRVLRVETQGDPFEPVDLEAVFDDVLADLQFRIEESDAEITAESFPPVEGDASQLRQVFQNLLTNAIEYSGDDPPRVHVAAERNRTKWIASVRDEEIGIESDGTERVFEVFQRLQTDDEHPRIGIGLALCKKIVERHDGEIWVESEPGEGSIFSVTLPAASTHSP